MVSSLKSFSTTNPYKQIEPTRDTTNGFIHTRRLTFDRMGLLYETGKQTAPDPNTKEMVTSSLGQSLGLQIHVNPTYDQVDDEDRFLLGWSLDLDLGFNITEKHLAPYAFDIGIWGAYMITDDLEVGAQYCFLGAYSYQSVAHFGASFSPAVRFKRFQLTALRRGAGAIRGCFAPKDPADNFPQHSLELMYYLGNNWLVGARTSWYHPMSEERNVSEFRVCIARTKLQAVATRMVREK
ncbi:MAG: hypothetical protein ACKVOR_05565 [Flavobacteriales bacterium]